VLTGVLVIDKPSGPSSHDIVARVRRVLRTPRVGHTGTLDPLATGVLPLVVGSATRLAQYLTAADKSYAAVVRLGAATDTYDMLGRVVGAEAPRPVAAITRAEIEEALDTFRGSFLQTPPSYSAKKLGGVRSYKLARRASGPGLKPGTTELAGNVAPSFSLGPAAAMPLPSPVMVHVRHLELVAVDGSRIDLRIVASAGFYVRSLAHDLGVRLGCGAHLEVLRRTRSGEFDESQALALETLEAPGFRVEDAVVPSARLLTHLPAVVLNEGGAQRAPHGAPLGPADVRDPAGLATPGGDPARADVRMLAMDGTLIGIARRGEDSAAADGAAAWLLHPVTVLV